MKKIMSLLFLIVATFVMGLKLYYLTYESYSVSIGIFTSLILMCIMWLMSIVNLYINFYKEESSEFYYDDELYRFGLIVTSALLVYILYSKLGINSVIAVAFLTLLGGIFLNKFDKEITIGAFVGMGGFLLSSYGGVIIASIIAYIVSFMLKDHLNGIGGKLGMTAFSGGLLTYAIFNESFTGFINYNQNDLIILLIVSIVSAVITYVLNNEFKLGAVISYSIVSLLGGIFLLFDSTKALGLTGIVFGSSFVGMSSKSVVKSYIVVIMAGFIFGLFSFIGKSLNGLGGRGGTLAIISVLIAINFKDVFSFNEKEKVLEET